MICKLCGKKPKKKYIFGRHIDYYEIEPKMVSFFGAASFCDGECIRKISEEAAAFLVERVRNLKKG